MRGRLKVAAALGAGALLAAGCGSSAPKQPPSAAINRAAYVSSTAPGYKIAMALRESSASLGQFTITGNGAFNLIPRLEGSMTMHLGFPTAASAGLGNLQMQAVLVPGTIYMKLPTQLAGRIPGGKPWLQITLSQLGKLSGVPGVASLVNSSSSLSNPGQYLQFLRATASGTVKDLGQANVGGVKTTHYHGVVDVAKLPNVVPASQRPAIQQFAAALRSRGTTQLPLDVWIDSGHLVRRLVMTYTTVVNGEHANVALQTDFVQYGPQPAPTVPPASQTESFLALIGGHP